MNAFWADRAEYLPRPDIDRFSPWARGPLQNFDQLELERTQGPNKPHHKNSETRSMFHNMDVDAYCAQVADRMADALERTFKKFGPEIAKWSAEEQRKKRLKGTTKIEGTLGTVLKATPEKWDRFELPAKK